MYRSSQLPAYRIYTDGSCLHNPGPGGYAVIGFRVLLDPGTLQEAARGKNEFVITGGSPRTTNNQMELGGVTTALQYILEDSDFQLDGKEICNVPATIYTDSQYSVNMYNHWLKNWERKKWRKADGHAISNLPMVKYIADLKRRLPNVMVQHVKGHNGNEYNEKCDTIAAQVAQGKRDPMYFGQTAIQFARVPKIYFEEGFELVEDKPFLREATDEEFEYWMKEAKAKWAREAEEAEANGVPNQ